MMKMNWIDLLVLFRMLVWVSDGRPAAWLPYWETTDKTFLCTARRMSPNGWSMLNLKRVWVDVMQSTHDRATYRPFWSLVYAIGLPIDA